MPFESEIHEIKLLADGVPSAYWIAMAGDNEIPFIKDGGYYKNLNIIRFEVPQSDIDFLTERVLTAGKMLIKPFDFKPELKPFGEPASSNTNPLLANLPK